MREILFQKQNKAKWEELESALENLRSVKPDNLADNYVELVNDLSFAKTHYPDSHTYAYLNSLAGRYHQAIYTNKKEPGNRFKEFWITELPLTIKRNFKFIALSLAVITIFTLIGGISAWNDENYVRVILGDRYVDMTMQNIKDGHPMNVYGQTREDVMFLLIALNNVLVAILSYVSGVALHLGGAAFIPMPMFGTLFFIFKNGVMLGAFHVFLMQQGVFGKSILSIWTHGTLEILTFIIQFAAGLILGYSILFPKTLSRAESFKRGAKDGLKIIVGTLPITIFAAAVESFITRHVQNISPLPAIIWIGLCFLFMFWYFIYYPVQVEKKLLHETND